MKQYKIVWNSMSSFFSHPEPNNNRWNLVFDQILQNQEMILPIYQKKFTKKNCLKRIEIFKTLWEQVSLSIVRKGNQTNTTTPVPELDLILVGYCILGLTQIFVHLLSERKLPGHGTAKRDRNVSKLKSVRRKIIELNEFELTDNISLLAPRAQVDLEKVRNQSEELSRSMEELISTIVKIKERETSLITDATIGFHWLEEWSHKDIYRKDLLELIYLGVEDLKSAGFECIDFKNKLKNVLAQKLDPEFPFKLGKIRRRKGRPAARQLTKRLKGLEKSMLSRYPDE